MDKENRRFTRVPFRAETRIEIGEKTYHSDILYNLSIGGCLLPIEAAAAIGDRCRVFILLNPEKRDLWIQVDGEIVRIEEGMIALRFVQIDPDSLFHLRNIILYNSEDSRTVENEIERHPGLK